MHHADPVEFGQFAHLGKERGAKVLINNLSKDDVDHDVESPEGVLDQGIAVDSETLVEADGVLVAEASRLQVKVDVPGNSGIQFRSRQREGDGVVYGYQAEIDCSPRRWSGGIYGESFTGWLDDLEGDPAGKAAFRVDEWNHYRIEARGDRLRVWVNGVQTADLVHDAIPSGFLALQVHGGGQGAFRWRNPRVRGL